VKFTLKNSFLSLVLCHGTLPANAQLPLVDIAALDTGVQEVEMRIRPDAFFNGVFSSAVFTLRWNTAEGITLGDVLQGLPQVQYCAISKSGPEQVSGQYTYQIFVGFGTIPFTSLSTSWQADQEVVLCRIPYTGGPGTVELADDAWTTSNNGTFYISLNGEDRTGEIYALTTATIGLDGPIPGMSVHPNPTDGLLFIPYPTGISSPLSATLIDASGRVVLESTVSPVEGSWMDLGENTPGVYVLRLQSMERNWSGKVVLQ
jgi:hypothetical protein